MRRLISIILCVLILFNTVGYYGVFLCLWYKNDREMFRKIDSEMYSNAETITIKIPFALPYSSDSKDFHRIDGKFEHYGKTYRLVKQRLIRDTLHIVCIRDIKEKIIFNLMADVVKRSSDLQFSSANKKLLNSLVKDYVSISRMLSRCQERWSLDQLYPEFRSGIHDGFSSTSSPPPKSVS